MRKYLLASVAALGLVAGASSSAFAQAAKPPAPGTLVVHLNGRLNDQINMISASGDSVQGGYKLNPIGMSGFLRLYPGFDAQTESGIQYGAAVELRTGYTSAGTGVSSGTNVYIRRAYGYVGTPEVGFVRFGQTDSVWWLLSTGEYYNFGDGNLWNSDGGVGAAVPSPDHPQGLFTSSGSLYTTNKIVYISPDIAGFKAGFDYEPNSNGFKEGEACNLNSTTDNSTTPPTVTQNAVNCATLASAPGGVNDTRRKNRIDAAIEYSGMFSGMGVKFAVGYLHAAPIGDSTGTGAQYKAMGVAEFSGEVKYAGFTVGANVKTGQVNTGYKFLVPGQRQLLFYEINGIYDFGPYTVGGYYFNNQAAGAYTIGSGYGRTETDYGIALGANYALSKNLGVYATYLYGHRHQAGYDFLTNSPGINDNVQSQAISLGAQVKW